MSMNVPLSERQAAFMREKDRRINLLTGSVRSGKTYVSLLKWAMVVEASPLESEHLMCGRTLSTLERNCLTVLKRQVGDGFHYSLSKKEGWLYGRRIWLEGANDEVAETKIRGMTLSGAYVDELTLVPENFYKMLLSRLSMPEARLYATTNPDTPGHWVKTSLVDKEGPDVAVWTFLLGDNGFLDPAFVEALSRQYTGVWRDRFILGRWVRAEGVIYPAFAMEPERYLQDRPLEGLFHAVIGVDFGGNKSASAFVAVGFTKGFAKAYVLMEQHRPAGVENPETLATAFAAFAASVREKYPMCTDAYCDSAEQILIRGLAQSLQKNGIPIRVRNARKGPILDRIRLVNGLFAQERLYIGPCPKLAQALADAVWDERQAGDARLDDGTTDIDTLDAFEYAMEAAAKYLMVGGMAGTSGEGGYAP